VREHVVMAVVAGEICQSVAARFGSPYRPPEMSERCRSIGPIAPGTTAAIAKSFVNHIALSILERLYQTPDLSLHG
jgi:hypothetical protein